jgi:hypothetical protein
MWQFTKHALLRMKERGFTENEILSVLNGDVPTYAYKSQRDETVDLYFGRVGDKFVMIPANREKETIITIRPMREKEREVYLKEVTDEKE